MEDSGLAFINATLAGNAGQVQIGDDSKLYVQFSYQSSLDRKASNEQGRPVYMREEFVRIQHPGERDFLMRPSTPHDRARFARQYQMFLAGSKDDGGEGTPLSVLFPANPEIVETLRMIKVLNVEMLAEVSDTAIQQMGLGGRSFVDRAKHYLQVSAKGRGFHELDKRLSLLEGKLVEKDNRIAALEAELAKRESSKAA